MFSSFVTGTLGFKPTRIDPDVYYKRNIRTDGTPYYEYLLAYVDDVLAISLDPKAIVEEIGKSFTIKDNKYGPPETYLSANIERVQLDDESNAWSMLSRHYVNNLIKTVEDLLRDDRWSSKTH